MDSVRNIFAGRRGATVDKDRSIQRPRGSMDGRVREGISPTPSYAKRRVSGTFVRSGRAAPGIAASNNADDSGTYSQQIAEYYAARLKVMDEEVEEVRFERDEAIKELQSRDRMLVRLQENLSLMENRIDGSFRNLADAESPKHIPTSTPSAASLRNSGELLPPTAAALGSNDENDPGRRVVSDQRRANFASSRKAFAPTLSDDLAKAADVKLGGNELVNLQQTMQRRVLTIEATVERLRVERDAAFKKKERQQTVQVAGLQAKIQALDTARAQAAEEACKAREDLQVVQVQLRELAVTNLAGQTQSRALSSKLECMEDKVQVLSKENSEVLDVQKCLRTELEAAEASLTAHQTMVVNSSSRIQQLERDRKELTESLKNIQAQHLAAQKSSDFKSGDFQKNLDHEKKSAGYTKTKLEKREAELKEVMRKLSQVEKDLRDEQKNNRDLQRQQDGHVREKQKLSKELEDQKRKYEFLGEKMTRQRVELQAAKSVTERERAALAQTVTQLERKLVAQEHALRDSAEMMKRTVSKMERGQKTLVKERDSLLAKTASLEGDLLNLKETNDGLKRKLKSDETSDTDMASKLQDALSSVDLINRERSEDVEKLRALNASLRTEHEACLEDIEEKLRASNAKTTWVNEELDRTGKDLWIANERSTSLERDLREKEISVIEAMEKLSQAEKDREESKLQVGILQDKLGIVQKALDDREFQHREKVSSLMKQSDELKVYLTSIETERLMLQERIDQSSKLQEEKRVLAEEVTNTMSKTVVLEARVEELEHSKDAEKAMLHTEMSTLENEKASIEVQLRDVTGALLSERKNYQTRLAEFEGANRNLEAQLAEVQNDLDLEKSVIEDAVADRSVLQSDIGALQESEATLLGQISVLNAEVAVLKAQCEETQLDLTHSQADVSRLNSECELLDSAKTSLHSDVARLEKAVEHIGKQYRMAEKARFEARSELSVEADRSQRLKTLVDDLKSKVCARNEDVNTLNTEKESLSQRLDKRNLIVDQLENEICELRATVNRQEEEIHELADMVSSNLAKVEEERSVRLDLSARLGEAGSQLEASMLARRELEHERDDLQTEIENLFSANEALLAQETKLKSIQSVLCLELEPGKPVDEITSDQLSVHLRRMKDEIQGCLTRITGLEEEEKRLKDEAAADRKKIETMTSERGRMMTAIQKMKAANRSRSTALDEELEDMSQKNDELTLELHALRRNLAESEKTVSAKNSELLSKDGSLEDSRKQVAALGSDLEALLLRIKRTRRRRRGLFFLFQAPVMVSVTIGAIEALGRMQKGD